MKLEIKNMKCSCPYMRINLYINTYLKVSTEILKIIDQKFCYSINIKSSKYIAHEVRSEK